MSESLIQLCDDLFSQIQRMKHPRCSIDGDPGGLHIGTNCHIFGLELHHLLEKSVYPCFRYEPMNAIILSTARHTGGDVEFYAHQEAEFNKKDGNGIRNEFDYWLQTNHNDKWSWVQSNKHRKHELLEGGLAKIYTRLRKEFEEAKTSSWMDLEAEQVDPRQSRHGTKRIK